MYSVPYISHFYLHSSKDLSVVSFESPGTLRTEVQELLFE